MPRFQVNYAELRQAGQRFDCEADRIGQALQQIEQGVGDLHYSWTGAGAQAFQREMDDLVLPGLRRLQRALGLASAACDQIARVAREAEAEAGGLFGNGRGGQTGGPGDPNFLTDAGNWLSGMPERLNNSASTLILRGGLDQILGTDAGKQLLDELKANKLLLVFPDGSTYGAPDGKHLPVSINNTDENIGGYFDSDPDGKPNTNDQKLVISTNWYQGEALGDLNYVIWGQHKNVMAGTFAHELQHAVDYASGQMEFQGSYDIHNPASIENYLELEVTKHLETEVRAHARGEAVMVGAQYSDDGVMTYSEADDRLKAGYESYYENFFNNDAKSEFKGKYTIDVWLDASGKVQVKATPLPKLVPIELPVFA